MKINSYKKAKIFVSGAIRVIAAVSAMFTTASASAASNMVYVEDTPSLMNGGFTLGQAATIAEQASGFTSVTFAFLNICSKSSIGQTSCNAPTSSDGPVLMWNNQPVFLSDGATALQIAQAISIINTLKTAGKQVFFSIGGASNDSTWDYINNSANTANATTLLTNFYKTYTPTGFDLDWEMGSQGGFTGAATIINGISGAQISIVPTSGSVANQYCNLYSNKTIPNVVNVQYYAGGYVQNVSEAISDNVKSINKKCDSKFSAENIIAGIAPTSTQVSSGTSNCNIDMTASTPFSSCNTVITSIKNSGVGGVFVWDYEIFPGPLMWATSVGAIIGN